MRYFAIIEDCYKFENMQLAFFFVMSEKNPAYVFVLGPSSLHAFCQTFNEKIDA